MAVTLPSDLVLDVMRNADPGRTREALARLNQGSSVDPRRTEFETVMKATVSEPEQTAGMTGGVSLPLAPGELNDPRSRAYRSFEKMMLQNMVETMLPPANTGVYGDQISGGIWRSMTADALSSAVSNSGGIGLSSLIAEREQSSEMARADQWPYFGVAQIASFSPSNLKASGT